MNDVYKPDLDSVLLLKVSIEAAFNNVLEIGVGSGFVLYYLVNEGGKEGFGTDISEQAAYESVIRNSRKNVNIVIADCASCFRDSVFDLVVVNPPYLVGSYGLDRSIFGGDKGIEVAWKMISDGLRVLKSSGVMFFVMSSLSDYKEIINRVSGKFLITKEREERVFFESLMVYKVAKTR